jgi:S1-C subfamily serine protease
VGFGGDEYDDEIRGAPSGDEGDDFPRSSLPDRLDRLWLHPSELSPLAVAATPRAKPMWTTTLVAGAAGAILTLTVLGALGALSRPAEHAPDGAVVPTSTSIATASAVAIAVGHSVVAVSAHDQRGTRRGSGVCVRRSGEILTSARLVGSAKKIEVTTVGGVAHSARVLGRDATTDLVLLRVDRVVATTTEPAKQPSEVQVAAPAHFAPHPPRAGDTMWVVGAPSPGDTSPWVSSGLVASTDSLVAVAHGPTTSGLLETAAASSAASSGGALVNRSGDVIGIVLSPVGNDRMTYAVPISTALSIANDLRTFGYVKHGALGINGIDAPDGPKITGMMTDGPAAKAGMLIGDIVASVDEHEVYSMDDVMARVRHDQPGQPVEIALHRGTRTLTVSARLTAMITP